MCCDQLKPSLFTREWGVWIFTQMPCLTLMGLIFLAEKLGDNEYFTSALLEGTLPILNLILV